MRALRRWFALASPALPRLASALLGATLCELSAAGLMALAAWLIVSAAVQPPFYTLALAAVGVRCCGLARAALRYAERYVSHSATFEVLRRLRVTAYARLEALAPARWEARLRSEDSALLLRQADTLKDFFLRALAPLLTATLVIAALALAFSFYAPALGWLALASLLLLGLLLPLALRRREAAAQRSADVCTARLAAQCLDLLQGLEVLAAYGRHRQAQRRAEAAARAVLTARRRVKRTEAWADAWAEALGVVLLVAAMAALLPLARAGALTAPQLAACALAFQSGLTALYALPAAWRFTLEARRAAQAFFALPAPLPETAMPGTPAFCAGDELLCAERLSFAYGADAPVLQNISFSLRRGERVAVVGASGAGKSTLLKLLLGFYGGWRGTLRLRGVPYETLRPAEILTQFRAVLQETHVFHGSLAENLRLVYPAASEAELWAALDKAGLVTFVAAQPQGLQCAVGQDGCLLSGGERQRLALARALLRPAPLLLLDEPTAGLDALSAAVFFQSIEALPKTQSVLLVTHELQFLSAMDRILVLEDGRIVEAGSFDELALHRGVFWRMLQAFELGPLPLPQKEE